ncbi:MAG TPA: hypothetical protein VH518_24240, partial [Tepidisphaeraceae bacterium]
MQSRKTSRRGSNTSVQSKSNQLKARRRLASAIRPCLGVFEQLESRCLLAASVYVGEPLPSDFTITNDADSSGPVVPTNGDTVTWNPGGTQHPQGAVPGLIFGTDAFSSLGAAIAGADAGGTVYVEAGTYSGNSVLNKRLTLSGAKFGLDARGRVTTPAPNPAVESVLTAPTGNVLELQAGSAQSVINGFAIFGATSGIVSTSGPLNNLQIRNNDFRGSTSSEVFLNDPGTDITVNQNSFDGTTQTGGDLFHLDTDGFNGFQLLDNWLKNRTGGTGFFVDGNHNVGPSVSRTPLISGNLIDNNQT